MKQTCSILILLALGLSGCAAPVPRVDIETVQVSNPIKLSPGTSRKIYVADLVDKLSSLKIGQAESGTLCVGGTELLWTGNVAIRNLMSSQVREELLSNGYAVSTSLLAIASERDADVVVGVALTDIKGNICSALNTGTKGEVFAELSWEVFDKASAKTVLLKSKGTSKFDDFSRTGDPDIYLKAVQVATRNFLSNEEFAKLVGKK
ncbi:hypothetical protein IV454_09180 [Massilia antarctica]|uniref:Lipoprotein n=1 Tax=Massilia antarctica TaxID=2765360 RepID=A0AA49A9H5_9BURK|nr:hypothetical protein [Massilia antarctica]QPI51648.1 hypothetical protein IV454_09180 [Massilia antarctica]